MFDFEKFDDEDRLLRLARLSKLTQGLEVLTATELFREEVLEAQLGELKDDVIAAKQRVSQVSAVKLNRN